MMQLPNNIHISTLEDAIRKIHEIAQCDYTSCEERANRLDFIRDRFTNKQGQLTYTNEL